jgi:hypothetical protein
LLSTGKDQHDQRSLERSANKFRDKIKQEAEKERARKKRFRAQIIGESQAAYERQHMCGAGVIAACGD